MFISSIGLQALGDGVRWVALGIWSASGCTIRRDCAGDDPSGVLVVPAQATHSFSNTTGSGELEIVSIHPVAEMQTEWLEPA